MTRLLKQLLSTALISCCISSHAWAGYYPMYASWDQPDGPGSAITLTYSFSNLFDDVVMDTAGLPFSAGVMRSAFEQAFSDYAAFLPIHFVEVADTGPLPETGQYDPTGLADIRIGAVPHTEGANAYAYYPTDTATNGLAGDVVFNGERFGFGWSPVLFYAVAQHELGHSLGMGHYIDEDPSAHTTLAQSAYTGPLFPLDNGTITALQNVYGAGVGSVTPLSAVPEPDSWAMLIAGIALLAVGRRTRA